MPRITHDAEDVLVVSCVTCEKEGSACHCFYCRSRRSLRQSNLVCRRCCDNFVGPPFPEYKDKCCQRCGLFLRPFPHPATGTHQAIRCDCCDWADLCSGCCEDNARHSCCKSFITFSGPGPEPMFLFPVTSPDSDYSLRSQWPKSKIFSRTEWDHVGTAYRESSLKILGKRLSAKHLWLKGFLENPSRRFAAVEIEVSKYTNAKRLNDVMANWMCSVVRDSSIGEEGFEINSTPACGDVLLSELRDICAALTEAKAEISELCGLHVHVDARDFGYQDIQKLVRVYKEIEPVLFLATHHSREKNTFCHKCGKKFYDKFIKGVKPKTKELKQAIIGAVYPEAIEGYRLDKEGNLDRGAAHNFRRDSRNHYGGGDYRTRKTPRYYALNLHSYFLRGTIEFRLHHGSTAYWEIAGWAKMLVSLFDTIHRFSEAQILEAVKPDTRAIKSIVSELPTIIWTRETPPEVAAQGLSVLKKLLPKVDYLDFTKRVVYHSSSNSNVLPSTYITDKAWGDLKTLSWEEKA